MASHSCHRYDKDHALYVGYKPEERTLTMLTVCVDWQAPDHCLQDQFLKSCLSKWCGAFSFCFSCPILQVSCRIVIANGTCVMGRPFQTKWMHASIVQLSALVSVLCAGA